MNSPETNYSLEREPKVVTAPPPAESLLHLDDPNSMWPQNVRDNPELREDVAFRNHAIECVNNVFNKIDTTVDWTYASDRSEIKDDDLVEAYKALTHLLQSDRLNERLILYLPFEVLPNEGWRPHNRELRDAADDFLGEYRRAWYNSLDTLDVRENFVEGDVLEYNLRREPLERVSKVAHFIPKLMQKNIIDFRDVVEILEHNPSEGLLHSIIDTLPILVDMGEISQYDLENVVATYDLDLNYRKERVISDDQNTEARQKWLSEKDKDIRVSDEAKHLVDKPFEERRTLVENELSYLSNKVELALKSPEALELIYPACILMGSRLKGYASTDADVDIVLFVRPGVTFERKNEINKKISNILSGDNIGSKFFQYWLEDSGDKFDIREFPNVDPEIADKTWSHDLFEGAWVGDKETIKDLHDKLLTPFLYSHDKTIHGGDARTIWLEEMEKDTLQYRLMHKGYDRLFPKIQGINSKNADRIDGNKTFFDPGYRRLATKLYLGRVFLPQLSNE